MSPAPPVFRIVVPNGAVSSKTMLDGLTMLQRWVQEVVFGDDIVVHLDGNTIELTPRPHKLYDPKERRAV